MKRKWLLPLATAAVLLGGFVWLRFAPRVASPASPAVSVLPADPGQTVAITNSPEEIFRRAFWRHPSAADRIAHGDRREWSEKGGAVQRWQWFLQVHPGPDLLHTLRDPSIFGLVPTTAPRPSAESPAVPDWFPAAGQLAGTEVLQAPAGGLTVYYRAADNVLFATDAGRGFAPPAAPLARR